MKHHLHLATGKVFPRGLNPTPRHLLAAAEPFRIKSTPPAFFFIFPRKVSMWGNGPDPLWPNPNGTGDCVGVEEALNQACSGRFVSDPTLYAWCKANGTLDGADLQPVIQQMQQSGFRQDGNIYGDGAPLAVNYADLPTLQAALYQAGMMGGTIKLGLAADSLPQGAGNNNGWTLAKCSPDTNEDHCMGANGYGTISEWTAAYNAAFGMNLAVPTHDDNGSPIDPNDIGISMYTWLTFGWASHKGAVVNFVGEAWARNPATTMTGTGTPTPDSVYVTGNTPPPAPPSPTPPSPIVNGELFPIGTVAALTAIAASGTATQPTATETVPAGTVAAAQAAMKDAAALQADMEALAAKIPPTTFH